MKKKIGQVYCATNKINGKRYFGFTNKTKESRWKVHVKGGRTAAPLLHEAIVEFGKENFILETVFTGTEKHALKKERWFIKKFKSKAPNGYNQTNGGEAPFLGKIHSEEAIASMREANTGNKNAQGLIHTPEAREKMRKARVGRTPMLGKTHTPEVRAKKSVSMKGNKYAKGHTHKLTAEAKAKISAALLRYHVNKRKEKEEGI